MSIELQKLIADPNTSADVKTKAAALLAATQAIAAAPASQTGPVALHGQKIMHCGAGEFASINPIHVSPEYAKWLRRDGHLDEEAASSARAFLVDNLSTLYFWGSSGILVV